MKTKNRAVTKPTESVFKGRPVMALPAGDRVYTMGVGKLNAVLINFQSAQAFVDKHDRQEAAPKRPSNRETKPKSTVRGRARAVNPTRRNDGDDVSSIRGELESMRSDFSMLLAKLGD